MAEKTCAVCVMQSLCEQSDGRGRRSERCLCGRDLHRSDNRWILEDLVIWTINFVTAAMLPKFSQIGGSCRMVQVYWVTVDGMPIERERVRRREKWAVDDVEWQSTIHQNYIGCCHFFSSREKQQIVNNTCVCTCCFHFSMWVWFCCSWFYAISYFVGAYSL